VEDVTIIDYDIIFRNKKIVGMVMLVLGVLGVANAFEHSVLRNIFGGQLYWAIKRSIVPIALVLAGVYVLGKAKKTVTEEEDTENDMEV